MEEYHIVAKYAPDLLKQYIWDEDTGLVLQEYETRLVKETDPLGNIEDCDGAVQPLTQVLI